MNTDDAAQCPRSSTEISAAENAAYSSPLTCAPMIAVIAARICVSGLFTQSTIDLTL